MFYHYLLFIRLLSLVGIVCSPPGTDDPVPVSTTTAFIFSSDSEGEEIGGGGGGVRGGGGGGGGGGGVRGGMKHSKKKKKDANIVDDGWVIDEDDYCILSTPTTAKVVRYFVMQKFNDLLKNFFDYPVKL